MAGTHAAESPLRSLDSDHPSLAAWARTSDDKDGVVNLRILDVTLQRLGIPMWLVSLGSTADSAWCIVPAADGRWEVFWHGAGVKHSLTLLDTEATACYVLLGKLVHDQVLAGQFELPG